jgi:hypothetical protein
MWRDIRDEAFILTETRCPCYCGGEGMLVLVTCPACGTVMKMKEPPITTITMIYRR